MYFVGGRSVCVRWYRVRRGGAEDAESEPAAEQSLVIVLACEAVGVGYPWMVVGIVTWKLATREHHREDPRQSE